VGARSLALASSLIVHDEPAAPPPGSL